MEAGEMYNTEGKQAHKHVLVLTTKEARKLMAVMEAAVEKKVKGSKPLKKKLDLVLHCF